MLPNVKIDPLPPRTPAEALIETKLGRHLRSDFGLMYIQGRDFLTVGWDNASSADAMPGEVESDPGYYQPLQLTSEERDIVADLMISRWKKWKQGI